MADRTIYDIAVGEGVVYVSGNFSTIGGSNRRYIAELDAVTGSATAWYPTSAMGTVSHIAIGRDRIFATGSFFVGGGQPYRSLVALDARTGNLTEWNPGQDGVVSEIAVSGDIVYVGGSFTSIGGQLRDNVAALDGSTGGALPWNPGADGWVQALTVDRGRVYLGGFFNSVHGQPRRGLGAVDAATAEITGWNPGINNSVEVLTANGGTVYAAGSFSQIGGESRAGLAAIDAESGLVTSWNPGPVAATIYALGASDGNVFVGGSFNMVGGRARNRIAALDVGTGEVTEWNPDVLGGVQVVKPAGQKIYVGGYFSAIGAAARQNLAVIDKTSGLVTNWDPSPNGEVTAIEVCGRRIHVAGRFTSLRGGLRNRLAAIDSLTGLAVGWNPSVNGDVADMILSRGVFYVCGNFSSVGGLPRQGVAAIDSTTGVVTSWDPGAGTSNSGVYALATDGGPIYVAGYFAQIGGGARRNLAAIDPVTGLASEWNPEPLPDAVTALAARSGTVYAGGYFETIGGAVRRGLAALDARTGEATEWRVDADPYSAVTALSVSGSTVYAGGTFNELNGRSQKGLAAIRAPALIHAQESLSFSITVGDTTSRSLSVRNLAFETLTITGLQAPSTAFSLSPAPPIELAAESESTLTIMFHPIAKATPNSGQLRLASDDPYGSAHSVPVSFEALGLNAEVRALVPGDSAMLGEAVTVQAVPEPAHHVESADLFFRSTDDVDFTQAPMDTVGRTFVGVIPGRSVREGFVEYYVRLSNSGVTATYPDDAPSALFRIPVAPPTAIVAVPRATSPQGFLSDSSITVEVTLPDAAVFRSGGLHFRRGGDSNYQADSLEATDRPEVFAGLIPREAVGPRGVEYWVGVTTLTAPVGLTFPRDDAAGRPGSIRVVVKNFHETVEHAGGRYRLLGLPLDFGAAPPTFMEVLASQLGPYDVTNWRGFRYLAEPGNSDLGHYVELNEGDASGRLDARPGSAFWLVTRDSQRIGSGLAPAQSTPGGQDYPIALERGWNMIANPFAFPVAWAAVRKSSASIGEPVQYDPAERSYVGDGHGHYAPPEVLEPFSGYFLKVEASAAVSETLWVPPVVAPGPSERNGSLAAPPGTEGAGAWALGLQARTHTARDLANLVGVDARAKDEYDSLDQPEPPQPPGSWVQLALVNPGWRARPGPYRCDLRSLGAEGSTWKIEVRSAVAGEEVVVEPVRGSAPPEGVELRLLDRETGGVVELGRGGEGSSPFASYRMLSYGPARAYRLTLLAGRAAYVERVANEERLLPERLALDPCVPNPSHGAVRMRFGLPTRSRVSLEVFGVRGERVATPLPEALLEPGYHALIWGGTGPRGTPLANGVYFLRLNAGGRSILRRFVLIR